MLLKVKNQKDVVTKNTKIGRCPHCNAAIILHKRFGISKTQCICCDKHVLWDK